MYTTKKMTQKISNILTLPFPKPAHLQWAQDQGAEMLKSYCLGKF